jgi:spermidine/putrescine transport system substrate-binding protein
MKGSEPSSTPYTSALSPSERNPLGQLSEKLARGSMSRREFLKRATALGLSVSAAGAILAACGGEEAETAASPAPLDTTLPDQLNLYNWSDYLPPSVKKSFEKKYGIKVVESYYDGNEELLAKLMAGTRGYDLVVPDNITVHIMIKQKLLLPLHMDLIPNYKNVMEMWQNPGYNVDEQGNQYSVPYQWGTSGVGHRKDIVPETIDSWASLWNKDYKGQITMLNDYRETIGAALKLLGYSLNSTSQDELDQATQKLIEQKPLVAAYDSINTRRLLIQGTPLCHGWTGYVLQAYDVLGPDKLEYVLPKEGYMLWCDNIGTPVGAPSPYAAHLFMDYLFDPKIAAEVVDYTWYHSPISAAEQYSDPLVWKFVPDEETAARGEFSEDVAEFARNYLDAWKQVRGA